jgi:teichoic acid transport system ATP-binding protein
MTGFEPMDRVIRLHNVDKSYRLFHSEKNKLFELLFNSKKIHMKHALRDITLNVERGECLGLLGLNGSGKTTLANIIAGTTVPSGGTVSTKGEVAILSVNVGLNHMLTGLENIEYKNTLLGYVRAKREELLPQILDFADIGEYIMQPVRTYSAGMMARLGFAISIMARPDIMVIDEGLSVGDQSFSNKCLNKMNELRESGMTIIFVSHSLPVVRTFCSRALWLNFGIMQKIGDVTETAEAYKSFVADYGKMSAAGKETYKQRVLGEYENER